MVYTSLTGYPGIPNMRLDSDKKTVAWLQTSPSLSELRVAFPDEWEAVERQVVAVLRLNDTKEVVSYLEGLSRQSTVLAKKARPLPVSEMVRYQMAHAAITQHCLSVVTGIESGKARFNLLNGFVAQRLLFSRDLERKPVSLFWFRLIWPLLWQKRLLMPLVQPKGIYCFYSRQLIEELSKIIGNRDCLEIAAGDGTLSRFLSDQGVHVTSTDDYSWRAISYPKWVEKMNAKDALSRYCPEIVICSWPPARNNFERLIFKTRSVQRYILITSRHPHAAGNWDAYGEQQSFTVRQDTILSQLVLPPEINAAVYLFTRKPPAENPDVAKLP
jgi:hypothetical protein